MNDQILLTFSDATKEVLKFMLDLDASSKENIIIEDIKCNDKVNISIGVTGDISGEVYYRFPKDTSMEMVKIMSGMEISEIDEFVTSAMGEVANIISGKALVSLSENQINCDIRPPQVVLDIEEFLSDKQRMLQTSGTIIITDIGNIDLDIIMAS